MRYIHFDVANKESYSLDSVGKHGFGRLFLFKKIILRTSTFSAKACFSTRSHGDRPPAARRGAVQHLHGDERWRAAHAGLGSLLQLRCHSRAAKNVCSASPPSLPFLFFKQFSPEVLFLKADAWTSSPWPNTWTILETQKVATSSPPFTHSSR